MKIQPDVFLGLFIHSGSNVLALGGVLSEVGVKTVLVIDDGYDEVPFPNDMIEVDDLFADFFDDLTEDDEAQIKAQFSEFNPADPDSIKRRPDFLSWLWVQRESFRPELCVNLFRAYSDNLEKDIKYLDELTSQIGEGTVTIVKCGRDFEDAALAADLVIIDRFLGAAQRQEDEDVSTEKLLKVLDRRRDNPPLIILMSRRDSNSAATEAFRVRAQMFASGFRFLDKRRISLAGQLEHVFTSLARQRAAYIALSSFINSWQNGLSKAAERTIALFRGLDAEDWAQTQDLLLKGENQSLGSYILDLSDRVLLHELEGDDDVISKAQSLTGLSSEFFPPSTATGQKDTLSIVERTQLIHPKRRAYAQGDYCPVIFGDILVPIEGASKDVLGPFNDPEVDAFLVVTPACDLLRIGGAKRVVIIAGKFKDISQSSFNPLASGARTPVYKKRDGSRVSIEWDQNHIEALSITELKSKLDGEKPVWQISGTLREAEATSIQQIWTGHMSRVANLPTMTATFHVKVRILYPTPDDNFAQIRLLDQETFHAVCYVGREGKKKLYRIPLPRDIEHAYMTELDSMDIDHIHERSRGLFRKAKESSIIARLFAQGIQMDELPQSQRPLNAIPDDGNTKIGHIIFNQTAEDVVKHSSKIRTAGLIFEIWELPIE